MGKMIASKGELKELNESEFRIRRIDKIVEGGTIDSRLGEYCKNLVLIDFLSIEAEENFYKGDFDVCVESLSGIKLTLDAITNIYFDMHSVAKGNAPFGNYQELVDLAERRYENLVNKFEKLLVS